jgi:hypothetical protein
MKKKIGWALVLTAALLVAPGGWCQETPPPGAGTKQVLKDVIPKGWLKKKTTIEKAEQDHLVTDKRLGPKPVPFGFINAQWEKFKAGMRPGDELWEFESPGHTWVIDAITTRMN